MKRLAFIVVALAACSSDASESPVGNGPPASPSAGPPPESTASPAAPGASSGGRGGAPAVPSRCVVTAERAACEHQQKKLGGRDVAYATPAGAPPKDGWPAVVYFQGSFVAGSSAFEAPHDAKFDMYKLTLTMKSLLDRGFAVIAPDADGALFWQTNIPPYSHAWPGCDDDVYMQSLFADMAAGSFGAIDTAHLHAMGISSGGFMTSRMAVSYAGKFRSLAIHSGSYATCGKICNVPSPLPADHPPTLFVHGDEDTVVSPSVMEPYLAALVAEGHETKLAKDPKGGHVWLDIAVTAIPAWFDAHR